MSDRGERPIRAELLCLSPSLLSLAISVLPANRSQVVRSAYHEDQRLSVSPSFALTFSHFSLFSTAPYWPSHFPYAFVCVCVCVCA